MTEFDIKPLERWDLREQVERCYNLADYYLERSEIANADSMRRKAHYLEKLLVQLPALASEKGEG